MEDIQSRNDQVNAGLVRAMKKAANVFGGTASQE
jgi:hypothetical protein